MYVTSVVEEARQSGSLIARFLRSTFPAVDTFAADFDQKIAGATTVAPANPAADYPWAMVGMAIDYRIRFYFDVVPVSRLLAFKAACGSDVRDRGTGLEEGTIFRYGPEGRIGVSMPRVVADFFESLRTFMRRVRPARRRLPTEDEAWLCRYCVGLALVDRKITGRLRSPQTPLHALKPGATLQDLFALIPSEAVADVCRLSRRFLETDGKTWLTTPVVFDPFVSSGSIGASADVLVDDYLLDLKTTIHPRLTRAWIDQLLTYLLLGGGSSSQTMNHIGFYLVRQARMISWPVDSFPQHAHHEHAPDLRALRREFRDLVARSSRLSPAERGHASRSSR